MTDLKLDTVRLGAHGPMVGRQGYGAMTINTGYYGSTDEAESAATLEHALELGVTLFDTPDSYGDGANERLLAPFAAAHRDEIVIASWKTVTGVASPPGSQTATTRPISACWHRCGRSPRPAG